MWFDRVLGFKDYLRLRELVQAAGGRLPHLAEADFADDGLGFERLDPVPLLFVNLEEAAAPYEGDAEVYKAIAILTNGPAGTRLFLALGEDRAWNPPREFAEFIEARNVMHRHREWLLALYRPKPANGRPAHRGFDKFCFAKLAEVEATGANVRGPNGRVTSRALDIIEWILVAADVPARFRRGGTIRDAVKHALRSASGQKDGETPA